MGTSAHRLVFPNLMPKRKLVNTQATVELNKVKIDISLTADRNIVSKDEHYELMEMIELRMHHTLRYTLEGKKNK